MANQFCRQLSNGYKINVHDDTLYWSPCCFYSKRVNMYDTETWQREMEYARNATGWIPECNSCKQLEETGVDMLRPRIQSMNWIPENSIDGDVVNLELSFDTKCNAACMSCGSYCSTTWQKFEEEHNITLHKSPIQFKLNNRVERIMAEMKYKITLPEDANDVSDVLFAKLTSLLKLDKLRNIFILGGEPFYTKSHIKMLRLLDEVHPDLSQVTLRYQTNGSIYPNKEVLEHWKNYKLIVYGVSFDDIGERFDYLRWPLKWDQCSHNLIRLLNETNVGLHVNATLSPFNIYYYDELHNWLYDNVGIYNRLRTLDAKPRPNPCMGDMDLRYTSPKLREKILKKYGEDHDLAKVLKDLDYWKNHHHMFNYVEKIDKLRGLDWRKVFPDIIDCY